MTTIAQRVHQVFDRTVTVEGGLTDDLRLDDDLGYDSLGVMEVVVDLEEEFGIEITDDAMEAWRTVGDVIKTVQRLVS
ncbi:acyl carrier protein [uncultured Brevundimonas sp.]|jgi:acyl carrier protein|uniref:phosphopantetheine-binding protein n=1 Tax=uncultured Brevundimonas sp. TaxID=213418 RepID=UPI00261A04E9|nr:acyl carrier protein [uncultured Brevundimonas sp.]